MDDEGNSWLEKFPAASLGPMDDYLRPFPVFSPHEWTVLDPSGVWLGEVVMPERFELHAVAFGRVYGVHKDLLDVSR